MNGLKNQEICIYGVSPPDADFMRVSTLLRNIQPSGAVAFVTSSARTRSSAA
jgi:hypothetical protein